MKQSKQFDALLQLAPIMDFNLFLARLVVSAGRLGLCDSELADRARLCYSTIHRIMRRESKNMYVTTVYKLARAVNVSADWLMGLRMPKTKAEKTLDIRARDLYKILSIVSAQGTK